MSLRYAILGLLSLEDQTGYELSKRFSGSLGLVWSAKHSQIYPELAKLADEGMVRFQTIEQDAKPTKKLYAITEEGREALSGWLATPPEPSTFKDPLLLKAFCAGQAEREPLVLQLEEAAHGYRNRLAVYQEIERELARLGETDPSHPWVGGYLVLRFAMMQASAYVAWCEWTLDQLVAASPTHR